MQSWFLSTQHFAPNCHFAGGKSVGGKQRGGKKCIKKDKNIFQILKRSMFNSASVFYFLLYFITNGDFLCTVYYTEFYNIIDNSQCTAFNARLLRLIMYSAGQHWSCVNILFFGSKYKQAIIIYSFTPDTVSPCSPLAVAPHLLGSPLKLMLVSSETRGFDPKTLWPLWRICFPELGCGWHPWLPRAEQSLLPSSMEKTTGQGWEHQHQHQDRWRTVVCCHLSPPTPLPQKSHPKMCVEEKNK